MVAVQISREEWFVLLVELRQWVRERKKLNPYPYSLQKYIKMDSRSEFFLKKSNLCK